MLQLANKTPFAEGNYRACYVHPEKINRCVKVLHPWNSPDSIRKNAGKIKRWLPIRFFDENLAESAEIIRIQKRLLNGKPRLIPKTYGSIETDLGNGLVVDLFRNPDGRISENAANFVKHYGYTSQVDTALEDMLELMLAHRISLKDPGTRDVVLHRKTNGNLRARIIDGIGAAGILPAPIHSD